MKRFRVARLATIVEEDLDGHHTAARGKIQPHDSAVGERQLARMYLRGGLDAGGRTQLERRVNRSRGVRGPVAHLSGAEIPEAAPVVRDVVIAVRAHRGAADPQVPIERGRHAHFRRNLLQPGRMRAGRGRDVGLGDVADGAAPHDLRGHAIAFMREALIAHLGRNLVLDCGLLQQARLPHGARQGLLQIDVNATLHAGQGDRGVHEIGDAYGDGVDILALFIQHDAKVFVLGRLLEFFEVGCGARVVDVAQGDDVLRERRGIEIDAALPAAAYGGYVQLVVVGLVA